MRGRIDTHPLPSSPPPISVASATHQVLRAGLVQKLPAGNHPHSKRVSYPRQDRLLLFYPSPSTTSPISSVENPQTSAEGTAFKRPARSFLPPRIFLESPTRSTTRTTDEVLALAVIARPLGRRNRPAGASRDPVSLSRNFRIKAAHTERRPPKRGWPYALLR